MRFKGNVSMAFHWYVLRSKPQKEFHLFDQVLARGLECFFPRINVNPVNPRSKKVRPFFPGYMFINADLESGTSKIASLNSWVIEKL